MNKKTGTEKFFRSGSERNIYEKTPGMSCVPGADVPYVRSRSGGDPSDQGNPLPESVQAWIEEHPEAVICGEVQSCQDTEFSFSVYLKQVFLINRVREIPHRKC